MMRCTCCSRPVCQSHAAFACLCHHFDRRLQVCFGVVVGLLRDKAPNALGMKTFAANPTGAVRATEGTEEADVASVGCQILAMALHAGLLHRGDLHGLPIGDSFTVPDLIARRSHPGAADLAAAAKGMCVPGLLRGRRVAAGAHQPSLPAEQAP